MSIDDFARVPLTFGPSPVHRLERLAEHLGGEVEIWAKREDCNSGLAYGGNKTRKLEYLVADALAQGCDTLVSIGGVQSNHTRQVAAVAAHLGLACVLVQEHWVDWDDPGYETAGNILLSRIMGADVRLDPAGFDIGFRPSWEQALADVEERGGKAYAIPAGASDHPLGGHGFARWADEVEQQEGELGVFFDTIVVCSVTGSTQAGMIAGFAGQEHERRVLGIDGSATVQQTWEQIARIARRTAESIGLGRELRDDEIVLLDEWHAGTYGIPDENTIDAIRLCARLEGMLTDPVYEGKSMAALIDLVRDARLARTVRASRRAACAQRVCGGVLGRHALQLVSVHEPESAAEVRPGASLIAVEQWGIGDRSGRAGPRVDSERVDAFAAVPGRGSPQRTVPVRRAPESRRSVRREQFPTCAVVPPQLKRVRAGDRLDPQRAAVPRHPHRRALASVHRRHAMGRVPERGCRRSVLAAVRRAHQPRAGRVRRDDRPPQLHREAKLAHEPPGPQRPPLQDRPALRQDVVHPKRVPVFGRHGPARRAILVAEGKPPADVHGPPGRILHDHMQVVVDTRALRERRVS
jgi:1-aminocyclopropane-1-carboxylate deaminase